MSTTVSTIDEVNVENITDQLLKRSQDAIWQLECWIKKQENDVNNNNSTSIPNTVEDPHTIKEAKHKQQQYVKQLKSLQRRSLYLKHNIHSTSNETTPIIPDVATFDQQSCNKNNRNSVQSVQSDVSYMENLVFEFKDLTLKLNELAQARKSVKLTTNSTTDGDTSRSSSSSSSSDDSLELKPLRIISRQNIHNTLASTSTQCNNTDNEIIDATSSPCNETSQTPSSYSQTPKRKRLLMSSLPSSPIRSKSNDKVQSPDTPQHKLRNYKSYHDGLINNKTKNNTTRQQIHNPFNNNNRLSLALFQNMKNIDEDYNGNNVIYSDDELEFVADDDTQDELDQNTVLSSYDNGNKYLKTPILTPKIDKFPPLQRSNSHESIFSKRSVKKPLRFYQFVTNTTAPTTRGISTNDTKNTCLEDTTVVSQQMFFKSSYNSNGTSSKALLSDIINSVPAGPVTTKRKPVQRTTTTATTTTATSSIFANWSLFGKKPQSNIISETGVCKSRTGILKIKNDKRRPSNASSVVVSAVIQHNKGKTKRLSPSKKPIIDLDIRHNDLQDALNTELIL